MRTIVYNYKDLGWIFTKFDTYIALHVCQISAQSKYAFLIFVFVQKGEKKKKSKTQNLATHISETAHAITYNFGM